MNILKTTRTAFALFFMALLLIVASPSLAGLRSLIEIGEPVRGSVTAEINMDQWRAGTSPKDEIRLELEPEGFAFIVRSDVGDELEHQLYVKAVQTADGWKVEEIKMMRHFVNFEIDSRSLVFNVDQFDPSMKVLRGRFSFDGKGESLGPREVRVRGGAFNIRW